MTRQIHSPGRMFRSHLGSLSLPPGVAGGWVAATAVASAAVVVGAFSRCVCGTRASLYALCHTWLLGPPRNGSIQAVLHAGRSAACLDTVSQSLLHDAVRALRPDRSRAHPAARCAMRGAPPSTRHQGIQALSLTKTSNVGDAHTGCRSCVRCQRNRLCDGQGERTMRRASSLCNSYISLTR